MLLPLTAEGLLAPEWATTHGGGLLLLADTASPSLRHRYVDYDGLVFDGPVRLSPSQGAAFAAHLVCVRGPGPQDYVRFSAANRAAGWRATQLTEQARAAALVNDWAACGTRLDWSWAIERQQLASNHWDLFYASLRLAGACGGRFHRDGWVGLVPPEKRAAVLAVLQTHPEWSLVSC